MSLAHYFGCACIKPGKYFDNKPKDLQDKLNDFLLVTTHLGTQQTDCCLELVFTRQEAAELIDIENGFFLYEKPLPVSRVKGIYFADKAVEEQTITNINMSTAFVPENLIKGIVQFATPDMDKIEKPQDIHINSYTEQLKRFDSYLGGFSLLRLAGEEYMNYSENYFSTLSFFSETIKEQLKSAGRTIDNRYWGIFTGNYGFRKIFPVLNKVVDENDVMTLAQEEKQNVYKDKITRVIDLDSLDKNTYIAAVLNAYGVGDESRRKRIDELILSNFRHGIKAGKAEGIALCYGINRGYAVFSNKYSLGNIHKIVKFQLNSQLDYYTIESLYQYLFNPEEKGNDYSYLDWCPRFKNTLPATAPNYQILDVIVSGKRKARVLSTEYWQNLLPAFLQSNKLFEKKLPDLFQELGEILYKDTVEEMRNDFETQLASKQEEIKRLKAAQTVPEPPAMAESKPYSPQEETIAVLSEPQAPYMNERSVKAITEKVLKYREMPLPKLQKEANNRGIRVSQEMKRDEIIIQLMTTPDALFNDNE